MAPFRTLRRLKLSRVDLVPVGANPGAHVTLFKQDGDPAANPSADPANTDPAVEPTSEEPTMSDPAPTKESAAEAELAKTRAELEAAKAELVKSQEAVAKAAESETEVTTLRKALDETTTSLAAIQKEQRRAQFVTKAEEFKALGDVAKIGSLLESIDSHLPDEEKAELEKMLRATAEQVAKGALFAQFGSSDGGEPDSVVDQLEKAAADRVAKGLSKTTEQAKVEIMKTDRELAAKYAEFARS